MLINCLATTVSMKQKCKTQYKNPSRGGCETRLQLYGAVNKKNAHVWPFKAHARTSSSPICD